MNDSELEDQLRSLRPAALSPRVEGQIARELTRPTVNHPRAGIVKVPDRGRSAARWWRDLASAFAGAAAALVVVNWSMPNDLATPPHPITNQPVDAHPTAVSQTFEPAESVEVMNAAAPTEEWVETSSGFVRAVRYQSRETHAWANPKTGARIELEVPRDNIVFLPASLQ